MLTLFQFLWILFYSSNHLQDLNPVAESTQDKQYTYSVEYTDQPPAINARWSKKLWNNTNTIRLENYIRDYPSHFPETQARLRYDKENIYVIFHVKDRYVKATAKETNGRVWEDSCVEFFFTPGPDVSRGYFNLETNCKGIFLLQYHKGSGKGGYVDLKDAGQIEISHSLEKNVENETAKPLTWIIEYRIPFSILSKYMEVDYPESGVKWRANFYKIVGDKTSHPHRLTWAPIVHPKPNFHLPEFFGWLEFKDKRQK